mgnify:CR=1 FL=1|jgi:hypothetical protein
MKKILQTFLLSLVMLSGFLCLAPAGLVHAEDVTTDFCSKAGNKPVICKDAQSATKTDPVFGESGVVTRGIRIFLIIIGIISIFVILVNAVRMITSDGNADSFNSARNGLIYAAIGLVVVVSAQAIVSLLVRKV